MDLIQYFLQEFNFQATLKILSNQLMQYVKLALNSP